MEKNKLWGNSSESLLEQNVKPMPKCPNCGQLLTLSQINGKVVYECVNNCGQNLLKEEV
jgi:predicted RNA-binding Zn-ribbon protein involved in translation (DUF1610 family)